MTMLVVGLAFGSAAQAAPAARPDCRVIETTGERLACYDAAFPPKAKQRASIENGAARPAYQDPFLAEEARTTAKLKNICRGC
jgi:hypothetical protein